MGALIQIVRSGDVIPDIKKVVVPAAEPLMPDVPYVWGKTHVDIMLTEENKAKDPTVKAKNIAGFFKILETEGLSSGTVDRLIAAGYDDVCKIIPITKEQLLKLDGFKEKKATKIHKAINEALTNASPILIMKASNIFGRGFGERPRTIFEKYPDILVSKVLKQKLQKWRKCKVLPRLRQQHLSIKSRNLWRLSKSVVLKIVLLPQKRKRVQKNKVKM